MHVRVRNFSSFSVHIQRVNRVDSDMAELDHPHLCNSCNRRFHYSPLSAYSVFLSSFDRFASNGDSHYDDSSKDWLQIN